MRLHLHEFRQRAPVAAPHLAIEERVRRNRKDSDQPDIRNQPVLLDAKVCRSRDRRIRVLGKDQHRDQARSDQNGKFIHSQ